MKPHLVCFLFLFVSCYFHMSYGFAASWVKSNHCWFRCRHISGCRCTLSIIKTRDLEDWQGLVGDYRSLNAFSMTLIFLSRCCRLLKLPSGFVPNGREVSEKSTLTHHVTWHQHSACRTRMFTTGDLIILKDSGYLKGSRGWRRDVQLPRLLKTKMLSVGNNSFFGYVLIDSDFTVLCFIL